jgi:hypothetical protein
MLHGTGFQFSWRLGSMQIMHAVGIMGKRLTFDRSDALPAHQTYFELAEACMERDPARRPDFDAMQLVRHVQGLRLPHKAACLHMLGVIACSFKQAGRCFVPHGQCG